MKTLPLIRISAADYDALADLARQCLTACRAEDTQGTPVYTPGGLGCDQVLATRDFCLMVEGAGSLLPAADMLAGIDVILAGQREDGVVPDRVQLDGTPIYDAGAVTDPLGSGPPVDNPPMLIKLLCAYVEQTRDIDSFVQRLPRLERALDTVPLESDGQVVIDRNQPRPGYGFTDCVAKTGKVFMESLLYWEACNRLGQTCRAWEQHDAAHDLYERAEQSVHGLQEFWDDSVGMFVAASRECRQVDLWGSAYAAVIRAASKTQTERIGHYLRDRLREISLGGYIRHLGAGEIWARFLRPVPAGTHQNGGYWAIPTGWVARTIAQVDESSARKLVQQLLASFAQDGGCEWVSASERHLPGYTASVASLMGSCMRSKKV